MNREFCRESEEAAKKEQEDRGSKAARWMFNVAKKKGKWGLDPKIDYEKITEEELGWVMTSVLKQIEIALIKHPS